MPLALIQLATGLQANGFEISSATFILPTLGCPAIACYLCALIASRLRRWVGQAGFRRIVRARRFIVILRHRNFTQR